MTDVQCSIRRARRIRAVFVLFAALNAFMLAVNVILGSALAVLPAVGIVALLALIVFATRLIGSLRRTQELNRHAEELELAAEAVKSRAGRCTHPDAEPVDLLLTGERVGWVCPACNAELPATWTPPAKGTGKLTATARLPEAMCTCPPSACAPVGVRVYNVGSPVIRYCGACGKRISEDEDRSRDRRLALSPVETEAERAALHFAQLARVGLEFCPSYCPLCAERLAARMNWRAGIPADDAGVQQWTDEGRRGSGE